MKQPPPQFKKDNSLYYLIFLLYGYTATSVQILFLRAFLATFSGNEITIGIFFSAWLFWTAAGSFVWGKLLRSRKNLWSSVFSLQTFSALLIPATFVAIKLSSILLYPYPGEIAGIAVITMVCLLLLAPFGFFSGGIFAAGSYLIQMRQGKHPAASTARVYMIETAGSAIGGALFSLLLLSIFNAFPIAMFLLFINLLLSLYLAVRYLKWSTVSLLFFTAFILLYSFGVWRTNYLISEKEWSGYKVLAQKDSPYGRLTLIQRQENKTVLQNGVPLFTVPDRQAAEQAVHYGLLLHEKPGSVLLIGGGLSGAIPEILKHPSVQKLHFVEIDKALPGLGRKYFPKIWCAVKNDARVKIFSTDGRLYLAESKEKYDLIILNLPDPLTAQLNRFYTKEFFELASQRLKPGGIFTFRVSGAENYINRPLARYLKCLYLTLGRVFKSTETAPGETIHFFAKNDTAGIKIKPKLLIGRLRERRLRTQYIREYYIPFQLSEQRRAYLKEVLKKAGDVPLNSDFAPAACYLSSVFWSSRFSVSFPQLLRRMQSVPFYVPLLMLFAGILFLYILQRRKTCAHEKQKLFAALSMFGSGFSMISLELIIFLTYQALHGSLYNQLALLLGVFMAGMSAGTWFSLAKISKMSAFKLAGINLWLVIFSAITVFFVYSGLGTSPDYGHLVWMLLAFFAGMSGGIIFPVASAFYYSEKGTESSGTLYALDLAGSLIGAFLTAAFIIPLFGFKGIFVIIILLHTLLAVAALSALFIKTKGLDSP